MNTFCKEIELFLLTSNVSTATKERHRKNLLEFAQFLSNLKNINLDEVHLLKIFTLTTEVTGKILKHNPINS
jgi:integrase/recombinase XerD